MEHLLIPNYTFFCLTIRLGNNFFLMRWETATILVFIFQELVREIQVQLFFLPSDEKL